MACPHPNLVAMRTGGTADPQSPLADLLHGRLQRVLANWERVPSDTPRRPAAVLRFVAALRELEKATRVLCDGGPVEEPAALPPPCDELDSARSYAHLAGLLPRCLERIIRFDAAAAVLRRPRGGLVVDAVSRDPELGDFVRERALQLNRILAGGREPASAELSRRPDALRSALYVPLVARGIVVGTTYIASREEQCFSADDERVLLELASHASGAFQRIEGEINGIHATPRQAQVIALVAAGLSDKEIATRLAVSPRTVRTHLERVLRDHGLSSRTEAATAWLRGQRA
jgi:DNA-binding CsgD family transcriptional regulator